jgi:signal transduction histidine kinase
MLDSVAEDPARTPESRDEGDFARERFLLRARALFFSRVALLTIGLGILLVPAWKATFQVESIGPIAIYLCMVAYSAANYVYVERKRLGAIITFVTLCLDLVALIYLVAVSGGIQSPLLPTQLLYTMLFAMLFPRPAAIVPPLLTFPIVAWIQGERDVGSFTPQVLFLLLWYSAINCIVVYVVIHLHTRDEMKHRQILRLQASLAEMALVEERTRLAREIHDGLGGSLSSLILQAEYLQGLARDDHMRREIADLKAQAEESIEELRRALTLMRDDFDLVHGIEEVCRKFELRNHDLQVTFMRIGRERQISSEAALTLFRVLQESLTNVVNHADASHAAVTIQFTDSTCSLTVQDDGRGFDRSAAPPAGHYGLLNMIERAQRVSGTARVESAIGQGTIVSLTVPLAPGSGLASLASGRRKDAA